MYLSPVLVCVNILSIAKMGYHSLSRREELFERKTTSRLNGFWVCTVYSIQRILAEINEARYYSWQDDQDVIVSFALLTKLSMALSKARVGER